MAGKEKTDPICVAAKDELPNLLFRSAVVETHVLLCSPDYPDSIVF